MILDFRKLIKNYHSNLIHQLRGFNNQENFLQYWVPSEEDSESYKSLVETLYEENVNIFKVSLNKSEESLINIIRKINLDNKLNFSENFDEKNHFFELSLDKIPVFKKNSSKNKTIQNKNLKNNSIVKINSNKINEAYKDNLKNYKIKNRLISNNFDLKMIIKKDITLFIKFQNDKTIIKKAYHNSNNNNFETIIVDLFCETIMNKDIQEAYEHGLTYLENKIRPNNINKIIEGIIMLDKHIEIIKELKKGFKKLYYTAKEKFNYEDRINKNYSSASENWMSLSLKEKETTIINLIEKKISPKFNLDTNDISLNSIEGDVRININISNNFQKLQNSTVNYLIAIEEMIKNSIDQRLELFTIEAIDANKLRVDKSPIAE
jgi:hypothetical protein